MDATARDLGQGITRRRVIASGAAGAAVMALPSFTATATASVAGPALRRSTWTALVGGSVAGRAGAALEVLGVAGSDETFTVLLAGPADAVMARTATPLAHPAFGEAELFVGSVDAIDGERRHYELVIDRSVPLASSTPPSAEPAGPVAAPAAPAAQPSLPEQAEIRRYAFVRAARIGRRRGRAVVRLRFQAGAGITRVNVALERGGATVARGRGRTLGDAAEIRLNRRRAALRPGRYDLVITAVGPDGRSTTVRRPVGA